MRKVLPLVFALGLIFNIQAQCPLANPITTPYFEDFESLIPGQTGSNFSSCWESSTASNPKWEAEDSEGSNENSSNTGPWYDHTFFGNSGGKYVYFETSSPASGGDVSFFTSPQIDLTSVVAPELRFWYFMYGSNVGSLSVEIFDGTNWTQEWTLNGQQQIAGNQPWLEAVVDLRTYSDTIQLRFNGVVGTVSTTYYGDIAIDDVSVAEKVSCNTPNSLGAFSIESDSASLFWNSIDSGTQWQVQFGSAGFVLGNGTNLSVTNDTLLVFGLVPETQYEFYVREICGFGDTSFFTGPFAFTTQVSCVAPSMPRATNISSDSATIYWTSNNFGNSWIVEYDTVGTPLGSGNFLQVNNDTALLTGLNEQTQYRFYVREICGPGDTSSYSAPRNFTTLLSCYAPSQLGVIGLFSDSALVYWQSNDNGNQWQLEFGPKNFTPGTGTRALVTNDTASISGLNIATFYDFYVREICKNGDTSALVGPRNFTTACGIFPAPYVQDFTSSFPLCWTGSNAAHVFTTNQCSGSNRGYAMRIEGVSGAFFRSPPIDISMLNDVYLKFYYRGGGSGCGNSPETNDEIKIEYWDGVFWKEIISYTGQDAPDTFEIEQLYIPKAKLSNETLEFRVFCVTGGGNNYDTYEFDSIQIDETRLSICLPPNNLGVSNLTATEAELYWLSRSEDSAYQVEYGADGFILGTGTRLLAANDTIVLEELLPETGYQFYVREICGVGDTTGFRGPYYFKTEVSCQAPDRLDEDSVTSKSAKIYWRSNNSGSLFQILHWEYGSNSSNGDTSYSNNDTTYLTGLSDNLRHYYKVREICGPADTSQWSGNGTCPPRCGISEIPDTIDFETGATSFDANCMVEQPTSYYHWRVRSGPTSNSLSGPVRDHTLNSSSGRYTYVQSASGARGDVAFLNLPAYDLTNYPRPVLRFFYHMYGYSMGNLYVQAYDSLNGSWTVLDSIMGEQHNSVYDAYDSLEVDLSSVAANSLTLIRFKAVKDGSYGDMAIDDIFVGQRRCPLPYILGAFDREHDSATIYFPTEAGGLWEIEYGVSNFTQGYGTKLLSTTDTLTLHGLTAETDYDFYVRTICGQNDTGNYAKGSFTTLPTCQPTSSERTIELHPFSAKVAWNSNGNGSLWEIEYGPYSGFSLGNETKVVANSNPFTLLGLMPSTTYDFYVREICAVGDTSDYSYRERFTTLCAPVSPPDTVDFEDVNVNSSLSFPPCLVRFSTSSKYKWGTGNGVGSSSSSGPSSSISSKYARPLNYSGAQAGDSAFLELQRYDLLGVERPTLSFKFHRYGVDMSDLFIQAYDTAASLWITLDSLIGQQQTSNNQPFDSMLVDLTAFADSQTRVRLLAVRNSTSSQMAIDDITVDSRGCFGPRQVQAANVGMTSAEILITPMVYGQEWVFEFGPQGFLPGTGEFQVLSANSVSLDSLEINTAYDIYIRELCFPDGDTTGYEQAFTFRTKCGAVDSTVNINFEDTASPGPNNQLACFNTSFTDNYNWNIVSGQQAPTFAPSLDHTLKSPSGHYLLASGVRSSGGANKAILEFPILDLRNVQSPHLTFWHFRTFYAHLQVEYYDDQMAGWQLLAQITEKHDSASQPFEENIIPLYTIATDSVLRLRIVSIKTNNSGVAAIDDISIGSLGCSPPFDLGVVKTYPNAAEVFWKTTPDLDDVKWEVAYGPQNFSQGTDLSGGQRLISFNDTVLLPNLDIANRYDFYVRAICSETDTTIWVKYSSYIEHNGCDNFVVPFFEDFVDNNAYLGLEMPCWTQTYSMVSYQCDSSSQGLSKNILGRTGAYFQSPPIEISSDKSLIFSYLRRGGGSGCGSDPGVNINFEVQYKKGAGWVTLEQLNGANDKDFFERRSFKFLPTNLTGINGLFQFRVICVSGVSSGGGTYHFDDFELLEADCLFEGFETISGYDAILSWPAQNNAARYLIEISDTSGLNAQKYVNGTSKKFRIPPGRYTYRILTDTSGMGHYSDTSCERTFDIDCSPFNFSVNVVQPDNVDDLGYVRIFDVGNNGEDLQPRYDFTVTDGVNSFVQNNKRQHRFGGLFGGEYQVQVTDDFGCTAIDSFSLTTLDTTYVPKMIDAKSAGCSPDGFRPRCFSVNLPAVKKYQFSYRNLSTYSGRTIAPLGLDTFHCFTNLTPGFSYAFYARTVYNESSGNEFSPWSGAVARYLPPGGNRVQISNSDDDGGLQVFITENLAVFPNPVEGILNIASSGGLSEIALYDVKGQLVISQKVETGEVQLDLEKLPAGLYMLKVREGGKVYSERVVKE